ncbi:hypothetical protein K7H91_22545 [Martelella mediterranea]|uniref:hypothetical protein n=1 Tax=Martelella mediterranea TaxID=293089 RepID=UPI001E3474B3|nr:hypothetical protein [Martelella mediterranea]MCD1636539.1 hypothetical protein [Martelella mediterranea]
MRKLILVSTIAFVAGLTGSAHAETKLLFSTLFPPTHSLYAEVLVPWAEAVEEESGGSVEIDFAPSSLAPPPEQLGMVENGIADIAIQYTGLLPNRLTPLTFTEFPGPNYSTEVTSVAIWHVYDEMLRDKIDLKRVKILSAFSFPKTWFWTLNDKTYNTLEDFKGARIATTTGLGATAWGAVSDGVVAGPAFRYFEIVSKGIVDAYTTITPIDVPGFNLETYTKGGIDLGDIATSGTFILLVNDRKWRSLTDEQRAAIGKVSGEAFARRTKVLDDKVAETLARFESQGMTLGAFSPELQAQLQEKMGFIKDGWVESVSAMDIDGRALLDRYHELETELSGEQK